jgi:DNA-binding MurR/RpiR family transcriptional regulator
MSHNGINSTKNVQTKAKGTLARIRSLLPSLKSAESRAAQCILENSGNMINMTINELADKCKVADATIMRLCKKLGFDGFHALKISLALELVEPIKSIHEKISSDDNLDTVAQKLVESTINGLKDTLLILDYTQLQKAVEAISCATKVEFYGSGSSGFIANEAHHKMFRLGIPSVAYSDPHLQVISAAFLTNKDVVVGISHSGSNKDLIESFKVAKKSGATTICITSFIKSPITKVSDIKLVVAAQEADYRFEAIAARIAQICLIDILIACISLHKQEQSLDAISRIREVIALKRY